jgi:hypothetical protein
LSVGGALSDERSGLSFQVVSSLYNLEADQKLGTGCDSCCIVGDIVKRSPQRYLVTEVLNMWEVSMGGSHRLMFPVQNSPCGADCIKAMTFPHGTCPVVSGIFAVPTGTQLRYLKGN